MTTASTKSDGPVALANADPQALVRAVDAVGGPVKLNPTLARLLVDRMVGEGRRVVTVVVMTVHIVEETPHMLTQGISAAQERVSLRTVYLLGLLEQIRDAPVIDAVLEPWRFREEAG